MADMTSHTELLMWTVTFFFGGLGLYGMLHLFMLRGSKQALNELGDKVENIQKHFDDRIDRVNAQVLTVDNKLEEKTKILEAKKVDVLVYVKDRDAADIILKSLMTRDMCDSMRHSCQDRIFDKLAMMSANVDRLIENQGDFEELKGVVGATNEMVKMVIDRQKQVMDRMDKHINGTK